MKSAAKNKAVTSGRLTGKSKTQPTQRQLIPSPSLAAFPETSYSLYSSDSQAQVTSLHKGLDRCAALLNGILQADESDLLSNLGEAKDAGVESKLGKKSVKKAPAKTGRKSSHPAPHRPASATPRAGPHAAAAHSGVKLHPTRKSFQTAISRFQTPRHAPSTPRRQTPAPSPGLARQPRSGSRPTSLRAERECGGEEEEEDGEAVPVRDVRPQSGGLKVMRPQQERNEAEEGDMNTQTVRYLLGELKALITGEGSVAEILLRHLEQMLSSPLVNVGDSGVQSEADVSSLLNQNIQLRRQVEALQQQLKREEKAEDEKANPPCISQACVTQEELAAALSQLQELRDNLTELQQAHRDTQNQLRDKESINTVIMSDLEATRRRLLDSEREKGELATLCQQQFEELELLKRPPQSHCTLVGSSGQHQPRPAPSGAASERITHYLMSLAQPEAPVKDRAPQNSRSTVQHDGQAAETPGLRRPHPDLGMATDAEVPCGLMSTSMLSQCDAESVWSDWSAKSGSTFNTRDEAAFRDGLSALDASIANLMKTIQLDRGRLCT